MRQDGSPDAIKKTPFLSISKLDTRRYTEGQGVPLRLKSECAVYI